MFLSADQGPNWWQKIAVPYYRIAAIVNSLVLPLIFITWISLVAVIPGQHDKRNIYFSWNILYMYLCLGEFINYFTVKGKTDRLVARNVELQERINEELSMLPHGE